MCFNFWNRHHSLVKVYIFQREIFIRKLTFLPQLSYETSCIHVENLLGHLFSLHFQLYKNIWFVEIWQKCYELHYFDSEIMQICQYEHVTQFAANTQHKTLFSVFHQRYQCNSKLSVLTPHTCCFSLSYIILHTSLLHSIAVLGE